MRKVKKLAPLVAVMMPLLLVGGCQSRLETTTEYTSSLEKKQQVSASELNFSITEGNVFNQFFRQGNVAAHALFTSGTQPRAVVAFPAGNSGVSLWFGETEQPIQWRKIGDVKAIHESAKDGAPLHGVEMQYQLNARRLEVEQAILGSVRVIRSYVYSKQVPEQMANHLVVEGNTVRWSRSRLDGKGGYRLALTVENGEIQQTSDGQIALLATGNQSMIFTLKALTGDTPLTPITKQQLLKRIPEEQELTADVLAYLSYEEKMMAGSWRFQTYFGRDTLLSLAMLMPNLTNQAIEAGLSSVIERLSPLGEVAHEEDVGDFAILRHLQEHQRSDVSAIYDYKMMDDNYMLSIIAAQYLLAEGNKDKAVAFLKRKDSNGKSFGELLAKNFELVMETTAAYAQAPTIENLIRLKAGEHFGEWRDSHEGLGFGRIPYNVNAVFVPAALKAIVEFKQSGLVDSYLAESKVTVDASLVGHNAQVWRDSGEHFKVSLDAGQVQLRQEQYLKARDLTDKIPALINEPLATQFYAVSLAQDGTPVEIMNSDIGFALLFDEPTSEQLTIAVDSILAPFPQGLLSDVGMMVASGVYADAKLYPYVTNNHYHGEVIWSWQQALFAAGLNKQLQRIDLSEDTRIKLERAKTRLWQIINKTQAVKEAELWTWQLVDGELQVRPFGQQAGNKTESNAAQLWSTVYLAIEP